MKITITDKATSELKKKLRTPIFLLVLNDGSNKFSIGGGACSVGDSYKIVDTDKEEEGYGEILDNPDFTVYTSNSEKYFFGKNLKIDYNESMATLVLMDDGGILDGNLQISEI